jgi:CDP-diacylglycerol--glycerol-3-phosphate 3-phosphatidyltransferase
MLAYVLTLARVVLAGAFAACAAGAHRQCVPVVSGGWVGALLALAGAAEATDLLDGIAARRGGGPTRLGGLLDPLCDSLSRLTMYFAVALAGWVALAVPLVMLGRDLVVAYVRTVRAYAGGATAARSSGKVKAIVQGLAILAIVALAGSAAPWRPQARATVAAVVVAVTLWSLVDYVRGGWSAIVAVHRGDRQGRGTG